MEKGRNTFKRRGDWSMSELDRVGGSEWEWVELNEDGEGGQELIGVDGTRWEQVEVAGSD